MRRSPRDDLVCWQRQDRHYQALLALRPIANSPAFLGHRQWPEGPTRRAFRPRGESARPTMPALARKAKHLDHGAQARCKPIFTASQAAPVTVPARARRNDPTPRRAAADDQPEQNMSTPHSIPHVTPRFRIGLGTALSALGVLLAIAVTVILLALTGANHTTIATPVTASQASTGSTPQAHYLGPRQQRAAINPQSVPGTTTTGASNPAAHYACLAAARRCLR
jgi:hypothetical protein